MSGLCRLSHDEGATATAPAGFRGLRTQEPEVSPHFTEALQSPN